MKNLNETPGSQSPEPSRNPVPHTPRRRRVNLARAGVAIAATAILGLGLEGMALHANWAKPMPLAHKTVTVVSQLQIPNGHLERVFAPGDSLTHGDFSHLTLQTDTLYAGAPLEISAVADLPLAMHLPPQAVIVGPAGPTIEFGQGQTSATAQMTWRATVPATAVPSVVGTQAGVTYASWYVEFGKPGHYAIPVSIGPSTATATVDVVAVPAGGKVKTTMTPATSLHTQLTLQDTGNTPAPVTMGGVLRTLAPGQSVSVSPGSAYVITFAPRLSASIAESVFQAHGRVTYGGTITRHRTVAYRPARPPFRLPTWLYVLAALATLLLVASFVAGLTGGGGVRGRGQGTAGPKGTGTAGA